MTVLKNFDNEIARKIFIEKSQGKLPNVQVQLNPPGTPLVPWFNHQKIFWFIQIWPTQY